MVFDQADEFGCAVNVCKKQGETLVMCQYNRYVSAETRQCQVCSVVEQWRYEKKRTFVYCLFQKNLEKQQEIKLSNNQMKQTQKCECLLTECCSLPARFSKEIAACQNASYRN